MYSWTVGRVGGWTGGQLDGSMLLGGKAKEPIDCNMWFACLMVELLLVFGMTIKGYASMGGRVRLACLLAGSALACCAKVNMCLCNA